MSWLTKNKLNLVFIVCGVAFFLLYSWLNLVAIIPGANSNGGQMIFSWPDATANNFFINQFINQGNFVKEEPFNVLLDNAIHPRSTNVVNSDIVPTGFPGMLIVFGLIGKVLPFATLFITPFLAVISLYLFFRIIKDIFNREIGIYSAGLLSILGPYWYYANQAMLSTICFLFFLLLAITLCIEAAQSINYRKRAGRYFLTGLSFGLCVLTRPIELIWLILLLVAPVIIYRNRLKLKNYLFFGAGNMAMILVWIFFNLKTYGEYFTLGYLKMGDQTADIVSRLPGEMSVASQSKIVSIIKLIFIPFGFHPRVIYHNLNSYFVIMIWPILILFVVGFIFLVFELHHKRNNAILAYLISAFLAGGWLIFYYGNWLFVDKLVLLNNTIGSSYARYWVPLYILLLPVVAYFLYLIPRWLKNKYLGYFLAAVVFLGLAGFSINQVFFTKGDGLIDQKLVTETYYQQAKFVGDHVERNALIITDRADKLFFPKYQVIVFDGYYSIFVELAKTVSTMPTYYFTMMSDQEIAQLNDHRLKQLDLQMVNPVKVDKQFRLFKLVAWE